MTEIVRRQARDGSCPVERYRYAWPVTGSTNGAASMLLWPASSPQPIGRLSESTDGGSVSRIPVSVNGPAGLGETATPMQLTSGSSVVLSAV